MVSIGETLSFPISLKYPFLRLPLQNKLLQLTFPDPNAAISTYFKARQFTQANKIIHVPAAAIKELPDLGNIQDFVFFLFHNLP